MDQDVGLPEGFVLDNTITEIPPGFVLDKPVKLLPDFLNFENEESRQKRDELFKKDPDKYLSILQKSTVEGFNRGLIDIGEGLKQLTLEAGGFLGVSDPQITNDYTRKVREERERYEETYGLIPGAKVTRFIGNSAPYAYLPIKMPTGLTAKMAVGSTIGGGIAGTQYVAEGDSRALNMAAGATAAAAIPLIGAALNGVAKWADDILLSPFSKKSPYYDTADFLKKEISENRDKIEKAIQESIDRGESKTVAQIIAEYTQGTDKDFGGMLVRLEKDLSRESDVLKSIYATQSMARRSIIDGIAGTSEELEKALTVRANNASVNYKRAFEVPIAADSELMKLSQNKYMQVAIRDAKDLAEAKGVSSKENLTEFLHYVKEGLDKQLNATDALGKTALGREEIAAVNELKNKLINWISKKNTYYESARNQFQLDSVPINRMEVGNELKKAFISSLDQDKPSVFAAALDNAKKTIKKATGLKGTYENILEPKQVEALEALKKGLVVEAQKTKMARESKPVLGQLTGEITINLPHILSRPIVITNHLLKVLGKDRTPEYKQLLVKLVTDPKEFLKAYRLPEKDPVAKAAIDIVQRLNMSVASQGAVNAMEQ